MQSSLDASGGLEPSPTAGSLCKPHNCREGRLQEKRLIVGLVVSFGSSEWARALLVRHMGGCMARVGPKRLADKGPTTGQGRSSSVYIRNVSNLLHPLPGRQRVLTKKYVLWEYSLKRTG